MRYVIDCSFSSALFLPDERSDDVRRFFLNLKNGDLLSVPLLWWYETNNVCNVSVRRKRLNRTDAQHALNLLGQLRLETDMGFGAEFARQILELAQAYNLSSYDAVYMELAKRKKAKLMTLDNGLALAAKDHSM